MFRKNQSALSNRQKALIRLALIALAGAMLFSWLLYQSATASDLGTLQAQAFVSGQPATGAPYVLTGPGIMAGATGDDGMIVASNIEQGEWVLRTGCALVAIEVGEVAAQSPVAADATCYHSVFMPEVMR